MKKFVIAMALSAFTVAGLATLPMSAAQAGGKYCWAGYQYGGTYPCWAAEAFEPSR